MSIHESGEMYLEAIFVLSKENNQIRSIDIVNYTGYAKPSISRAVGLLKQDSFINIDSDGIITLTDKGKTLAKQIYERHIILTFVIPISIILRFIAPFPQSPVTLALCPQRTCFKVLINSTSYNKFIRC